MTKPTELLGYKISSQKSQIFLGREQISTEIFVDGHEGVVTIVETHDRIVVSSSYRSVLRWRPWYGRLIAHRPSWWCMPADQWVEIAIGSVTSTQPLKERVGSDD